MAKKLKGMTIEEHIESGRILKELREVQHFIANEIVQSYGKTSEAGRRAIAWSSDGNMLDKIICEMDNIVVRETDRHEWSMNGYGWIYIGGEISEFTHCQNCGKFFCKGSETQSIVDGCRICPLCEEDNNNIIL